MVLLVAVEEGVAGVVGDQVGFDRGSCFYDYHVFVDSARGRAANGDQFEVVPVQVDRVVVGAAVVEDQAVTQALVGAGPGRLRARICR